MIFILLFLYLILNITSAYLSFKELRIHLWIAELIYTVLASIKKIGWKNRK